MLIKPGVDISRLNRNIRRALCSCDAIFKKYGETFIVTSTYEGNHLACSLHYADDAFDCSLPIKNLYTINDELKSTLDTNYDVVLESDHIHIEFDPN